MPLTNNDLLNIKTIGLVLASLIVIGFMLYRYNKKAKAIMGHFGIWVVIFWDEVKEKIKFW